MHFLPNRRVPLAREPVQLRWPMGAVHERFLGLLQNAELLDPLAEVALIKFLPEYGFVELLQLAQGEFLGENLERDVGGLDFILQLL